MSEPSSTATTEAEPFFEYRAFPRRRAHGSATYVPADRPLTPSARIKLVDVSQGGLQFIVAKKLAPGDLILIEMQWSIANTKVTGRGAEVRWVAPDIKPGHYRVGCAWRDRLTYADLLRFS